MSAILLLGGSIRHRRSVMKRWSDITIVSLAIMALLISGCPSPVNSTFTENNPPWEVTGPIARQWVEEDDTFPLEVSDLSDPPNVYVSPGPFDPDGDTVTFEVIPVSIVPDPGFTPEATAENGVFSMVWHDDYDGTQHQIIFRIRTSDGTDETLSGPIIRVTVY